MEYEWDKQEACQSLLQELEPAPADGNCFVEHAWKALSARNQVKQKQMTLLVPLQDPLMVEQTAYLESPEP